MSNQTLFDALGGSRTVDEAAESFSRKLFADPHIQPYIKGSAMERDSSEQRQFLTVPPSKLRLLTLDSLL